MSEELQPIIPWGSFLPYHVARRLTLEPSAPLHAFAQQVPAVALSADVYGFGTLSEALSGTDRGAETLSGVLNAFFAPLIALIQSYGGIVDAFSDETLTAFFPHAPGERPATARRAVACALALQAHTGRFASVELGSGTYSLLMRIGIASGSLATAVVGDPASRVASLLAGRALDQATVAAACAGPGELVVHADLLPELGAVRVEPRDRVPSAARFFAILRSAAIPDPNPLDPLPSLPPAAVARVAAFLPPALAQCLGAGQASPAPEYRAVSVISHGFTPGAAEREPPLDAALQAYLAAVFNVVARYEGYVGSLTLSATGSQSRILFGTPLAHDDDAARALRCALELRELPGATARLGVARGTLFAGLTGSATRKAYLVIGDAVSLATGLMHAAAPGEILVADAARRAGNGAFHYAVAHPIQLRGRSHPITAQALVGLGDAPPADPPPDSAAPPLVGRDAELARLHQALDEALAGVGQVLTLSGPPGVGKSALAGHLLAEARATGATCLRGAGRAYPATGHYVAWAPILCGILGLPAHDLTAEHVADAEAQLRALDPRLLPRLPLLATLTGLPVAANELTTGLEHEARRAATEALAVDLIVAAAAERPLVIVLDDCQWLDPLARDLLVAVARRCAGLPVLLVLAYRSAPAAREDWLAPLHAAQLARLHELRLGDLVPAEAAMLVAQELRRHYGPASATPAALIERVLEQTQGNPCFIVELVRYLHERGVELRDGAADNLELPASLQDLVQRRIEQLDSGARTVIEVASVLGQEFTPHWLAGIYPDSQAEAQLDRGLAELQRSELARPGHNGREPAYVFRHVITREVAYERLTPALRSELHARVGSFIERTYANDLERFVEVLAHHYSRSDNREKQREYLLRAGMAAQAAFANEAAIGFYERLLPLLPLEERAEVLLRLGAVLRHLGRWEAAEARFLEALELTCNPLGAARARLEQGDLLRRRGDPAAVDWFEAARQSFAAIGDQAGVAESESQLGLIALTRGEYARALTAFETAFGLLATEPARQARCKLFVNQGAVYWSMGDLDRARACFEQGLELAVEVGNRQYLGVIVGNLGGIAHLRGDYGRALDCYIQKLQCALEIGDRLELSISLGNIGNIYEDQGELSRAENCYLRSLAIALELRDRMGVGMALLGLGTVAEAEGRSAEAENLIVRAEACFVAMEAAYELADCRSTRAELAARRGAHTMARALLAEALTLAHECGNDEVAHRCAMLAVELEHQRGALGPEAAVGALRALLPGCAGDECRADVLYAIVRIDGAQAAARAGASGLYRALHMTTPKARYRRAYTALMGVALPAPSPLPAPPTGATGRVPARDALLQRADEFLATLQDGVPVERTQ